MLEKLKCYEGVCWVEGDYTLSKSLRPPATSRHKLVSFFIIEGILLLLRRSSVHLPHQDCTYISFPGPRVDRAGMHNAENARYYAPHRLFKLA
jgi:hypothetical protein